MRALFEAGITPTSLVGTSVGAINAGYIAGRPTAAGVEELAAIWNQLRRADLFPLRPLFGLQGFLGRRDSLFPADGLRRLVADHLGFERLEQARVPLAVVATEVLTGLEVVWRSGPAVEAIVASAAIPGIFPSVTIDGVAYMDGGVADHTPLSHPIVEGADAVYVLPCGIPSGTKRVPRGSVGMVLQALSVLVQQRLRYEVERYGGSKAIYVVPPPDDVAVGALDFRHSNELIDAAYRSTRDWMAAGAPPALEVVSPRRR